MATTDSNTIVVGGGQAGLALSRCLTGLDIEHLVLEAGRVAQRWHDRWDSLHLLTPNWMTRLPGGAYQGPDPDGFMSAAETAAFFAGYARSFDAPVWEQTPVRRVHLRDDRFVVEANGVTFGAANVVVATGWCDRPAVPAAARGLSGALAQITPATYRRPDDLPEGGVLVVGASATGVQLADELHRSGRPVTLAVGAHTRMPRRYRGRDAFWWLDRTGSFDKTIDDCPDPVAARNEPSLQLVGRPAGGSGPHGDLDLATLHAAGVRLVGRLRGIDGTRVGFAADLRATVADADRRMARSLARIDAAITRLGFPADPVGAEPAPTSVELADDPPTDLDLARTGISTVVWATGFRRTYPWLAVPACDGRGEIVQRRGVTPVPGLYVLGQRFQHFRNSNFIDGVGRDAAHVARHIAHRHHRHGHPHLSPECLAS